MPVLIRGLFSGGGGKIKDADALPGDVRSGKVFYNNQGRQEGTLESNPWSDLKSIEITMPKGDLSLYNTPNRNDWITIATEHRDGIADSYPISGKVINWDYQTKTALKGQIKFVERLKDTKKYYVYSKEFGNVGGGWGMQNINGNRCIFIYHDGNYLYLGHYSSSYSGEKFRIWYRP